MLSGTLQGVPGPACRSGEQPSLDGEPGLQLSLVFEPAETLGCIYEPEKLTRLNEKHG